VIRSHRNRAFPNWGRWRFRNAVEKMTDEVNIPNAPLTSSVTALGAVTPSPSGEGFNAVGVISLLSHVLILRTCQLPS
jgi:hypothetical protein